jgi:hypothetical protein
MYPVGLGNTRILTDHAPKTPWTWAQTQCPPCVRLVPWIEENEPMTLIIIAVVDLGPANPSIPLSSLSRETHLGWARCPGRILGKIGRDPSRVRETFELNQLKSAPSQILPVFSGFDRLQTCCH